MRPQPGFLLVDDRILGAIDQHSGGIIPVSGTVFSPPSAHTPWQRIGWHAPGSGLPGEKLCLFQNAPPHLGQRQPVLRASQSPSAARLLHWLKSNSTHRRLRQRKINDRANSLSFTRVPQ